MAADKKSKSTGIKPARSKNESFASQLQRMKQLLAAGRRAAPRRRTKALGSGLGDPTAGSAAVAGAGLTSAGTVTVPRANVGAAAQAAVTFEGASKVTANAVAGTNDYQVAWS